MHCAPGAACPLAAPARSIDPSPGVARCRELCCVPWTRGHPGAAAAAFLTVSPPPAAGIAKPYVLGAARDGGQVVQTDGINVQGVWEKGAGLVDFERLSTNCPRSGGLGF